jgi:hypothetical protein
MYKAFLVSMFGPTADSPSAQFCLARRAFMLQEI